MTRTQNTINKISSCVTCLALQAFIGIPILAHSQSIEHVKQGDHLEPSLTKSDIKNNEYINNILDSTSTETNRDLPITEAARQRAALSEVRKENANLELKSPEKTLNFQSLSDPKPKVGQIKRPKNLADPKNLEEPLKKQNE